MLYATWQYYREGYNGELIQDDLEFKRLVREASAFLDFITQNRTRCFEDVEDRLKNAACAVAEIRKAYADGSKGIASETVGKESVSYAGAENKTQDSESYAIARLYLEPTGLLYLGINLPGGEVCPC